MAETGDVQAAIEWLENEYNLPMIVVGFSFGAMMALAACCQNSTVAKSVRALVLLGLPIDDKPHDYSGLKSCTIPKLLLSGDSDRYATAAQLKQLALTAADPKLMVLLPRADHFFTGQLEPMQHALSGWLKEQLQ